jgi:hypothetical protein
MTRRSGWRTRVLACSEPTTSKDAFLYSVN